MVTHRPFAKFATEPSNALGERHDDLGRHPGQHGTVLRRGRVEAGMGKCRYYRQRKKPASTIAFMIVPSSDAVGPLEFPDIGHDRRHIAAGQPLDRRHVPETPMMGPDAHGDRPLKRLVAMMPGLVYHVDQWRGDPFLSRGIPSMAGGTVRFIDLLPEFRLCREGSRHADRRDRQSARRWCRRGRRNRCIPLRRRRRPGRAGSRPISVHARPSAFNRRQPA